MPLFSHAMQLDPQQPNSPSGLARSYLALGRTQDAKAVLDAALTMGLDNTSVRSALYQLAILRGDAIAETEQAHWSESQPAIDNLGPLLAFTAAQRGRLEEAVSSSSAMCKSCTLLDGMRLPHTNSRNSLWLRRTFCIPECAAMRMPVWLWHVEPIFRRCRSRLPWRGIPCGPRRWLAKWKDPRG